MKLHHHPAYEQRACIDDSAVFDHLIDFETPQPDAILTAFSMCSGCPIWQECWTSEADEPWVQQLQGDRAKGIIRAEADRARELAARRAERVA